MSIGYCRTAEPLIQVARIDSAVLIDVECRVRSVNDGETNGSQVGDIHRTIIIEVRANYDSRANRTNVRFAFFVKTHVECRTERRSVRGGACASPVTCQTDRLCGVID